MKIQVRLFALARQLTDSDSITVDLPAGAVVADLRRQLGQQCPELADLLAHALFAVNTEYADDDSLLDPESEIACIPPVSGG
jgi:molybdopterin converting factor subunit 1